MLLLLFTGSRRIRYKLKLWSGPGPWVFLFIIFLLLVLLLHFINPPHVSPGNSAWQVSLGRSALLPSTLDLWVTDIQLTQCSKSLVVLLYWYYGTRVSKSWLFQDTHPPISRWTSRICMLMTKSQIISSPIAGAELPHWWWVSQMCYKE